MAKVAIVYHSGFGHTKVVAEHVAVGARSVAGTEVAVLAVEELPRPERGKPLTGGWTTLSGADGILFGAPTYMGSISAKFKEFMEASSGVWMGLGWKDKLAGGFVNSGSYSGDKLQAMQDLLTFAGQHAMVWVTLGINPPSSAGKPDDLNRLGGFLGAMTQSENAPPSETPPAGDRRTAEAYGKRFAEATARWVRGR